MEKQNQIAKEQVTNNRMDKKPNASKVTRITPNLGVSSVHAEKKKPAIPDIKKVK